MITNLQNQLRAGYVRLPLVFVSVIFVASVANAQGIDEDELNRKGGEWLADRAHDELIDMAKLLLTNTRLLVGSFDEEVFSSSTAPFNAAAAVKYSAEYEWRSRNPGVSLEVQNEFRTVAFNLAYDAVAEAADAAELCAEMAAVTNDKTIAEWAALLSAQYFILSDEFHSRVRESEAVAAGQRVNRAAAAASRAERFAKRHEP